MAPIAAEAALPIPMDDPTPAKPTANPAPMYFPASAEIPWLRLSCERPKA